MYLKNSKIPFPAKVRISFEKIFRSLEKTAGAGDEEAASYARGLLKLAEKHPVLEEGFDDVNLLEELKIPIEKLMHVLFPEVLSANEIKAAIPPFDFTPFFLSQRFRTILERSDGNFTFELKDHSRDMMYVYGCSAILQKHYGFPVNSSIPALIEIFDKNKKTSRTYRLAFNADLIDMMPTDRAVDITQDDYVELMDHFHDMALWKRKFPPGSWIMKGIGIANLTDVTLDDALSSITSSMFLKGESTHRDIRRSLRRFFEIPDLEVGFMGYENDAFFSIPKSKTHSLLMDDADALDCSNTICSSSYHTIIDNRKPMAISDIETFHRQSDSILTKRLMASGLKSYIIAPLIDGSEFVGFMELGSRERYALNSFSLKKLDAFLPLVSMAAKRFQGEFKNKVEAIIQQECTAIHPSVKWRFEQQALEYYLKQSKNEEPEFRDIIFDQVYPIYGQMDIKGSSEIRNEALKKDLSRKLNLVRSIIQAAFETTGMPIYDELIFRIDAIMRETKGPLQAGTEQKIQNFLSSRIYPVFDHLYESNKKLSGMVADYRKLLDAKLQTIYDQRKKFDSSVTQINTVLAARLDEAQEEAQKMFPHYFERYKTDGIEYNIYIGQSISRRQTFHPIYLQNLLIWQLKTMCEMEIAYDRIKDDLKIPLEISSLILLYSTALSIHFRVDEKQFDVEGAYNARYEIVKKRIDKAHIKGTRERITSPGKIAIVYSRDQDAEEYGTYIRYMQQKGLLTRDKTEVLEVEDLQGITGLKALRVGVNYQSTGIAEGLDINEMLQQIEEA